MKINAFLKLILLHAASFLLGTILFIFLFRTSLFSNINVLFYRGIVLLILSCIFMLMFMIFYKQKIKTKLFTYKDIVLAIVLIFCLNLVFFTHLPVTAERSISVFLLGSMNKNSNEELTNKEITDMFTQKYLYEYRAMDKRLNEQIISGNIIREGDAYKISSQGKLLIGFYSFIADLFNINKKLILP